MPTRNHFPAGATATCFVIIIILCLAENSIAQVQDRPAPKDPAIAEASDDAELAMATFKFPDGLKAELFAAEPVVANVVAFHVDIEGRVFVCETFRQEFGVEDNREHPEWLQEDLAAQSVQDRINYIRKHEKDIKKEYHDRDDRIRLLLDTDNDGRADESKIFSSGYNAIEDGTGAGVLRIGPDVFYTNIPHLWRLRDLDNDGHADERKSLHDGFGVRFAFRGHDLHGLIVGPDRRLYFSIGDRGYNVSPSIKDPASGAVFSCELDGSDLQVFSTGLRNPQELAFDDFGNLFTGDNNSDSGDKARWVYLLPGSDSGWRMYYQYLPDRGPFNREKIWYPYNEETPAYVLPPIDNLGDGPSGLAFYPGTGLTNYFKDRFFLCDFRGASPVSGIRSFRLKPKGAGFEIIDSDQSVWNILATDVEFAPDGKMYVSDWVHGWQGIGKGRIYSFSASEYDATTKQVQSILRDGLKNNSSQELIRLLGHDDRRVRYAAQFELEDRANVDSIFSVFFQNDGASLFQRIHALWAFSNLVRRSDQNLLQSADTLKTLNAVVRLALTSEPELKAQAAKLVGDLNLVQYADQLEKLLASPNNKRNQMMALFAFEKIADSKYLPVVESVIAANNDSDPYLRHSAIMALKATLQKIDAHQDESHFKSVMSRLKNSPSRSVRLATVVALRRLAWRSVADFLADEDPTIVLEAARAIHDLPMNLEAMSSLADLIDRPLRSDPLIRRVINANFVMGTEKTAMALANFATRNKVSDARRIDAVRLLGEWTNPNPLDYVLGDWRPINGNRDLNAGKQALSSITHAALTDPTIAGTYIAACGNEKVDLPIDQLFDIVKESDDRYELQYAALLAIKSLDELKYQNLLKERLNDEKSFPTKWFGLLTDMPTGPVTRFAAKVALGSEEIGRRRAAIHLLSSLSDSPQQHRSILQLLNNIKDDSLEPELLLDVFLAAKKSSDDAISVAADFIGFKFKKNKDKVPYQFATRGGDAEQGKKIFFERGDLSCLRCHTVGSSGGNVGPNLSSIGRKKTREYILESILNPNKEIAEGYSEKVILTDDGLIVTGIQKSEDANSITILDKDGVSVRIGKETIEDIKAGQSSMPVDLIEKLTILELRDLIEYLARQTSEDSEPATPQGH